ncbi:MAG: hypothetical protein M4D80_21950 [Myxococcota bacterium]|nr:hypothetical protein [Deltaproteobacteria bacterium]MDQ3337833.1 hypothetical protein [Myxococcota bacterium]
MNRLFLSAVALTSMFAVAAAEPPTDKQALGTSLPLVGETLDVTGAPGWPLKLDWLYDVPSLKDGAGKVVIHWFCAPKIPTCVDDLARVVTMKENSNRVYVVAYINGNKGQAKKLDPIRESEGVGRGTLAFGRKVTALFKTMKIVGPVSIVVDVEGRIALVSTGSSPQEMDARDAKVSALTAAIKEHTMTSEGPAKVVKPAEKFTLKISVKLAPWLKYSTKAPREFKVMTPKDITCDATSLKGDQLRVIDQTLTGAVTCSGAKGSYEIRGNLSFGYDAAGGPGLGTESANWKFEIKP